MTYEGPPFPNYEFVIGLYEKLDGENKPKDKSNALTSQPSQSENLASGENWCRHPMCDGTKKYASHTWLNCHRNNQSAHYKQQAPHRLFI
jgi:hypothetical protein